MRRFLLLSTALILPIHAQHDPGRGAVRHLAKGEIEKTLEVVEKAPKRSNSPIDEAEKEFVRAMVASHQGDGEKAWKHAMKASELGLPMERLLSAHELISVIHDAPYYEKLSKWNQGLVHGPMIGSMTHDSASFWVRTFEEADVTVRLKTKKPVPLEAAKVIPVRTSEDKDFTGVVRVEGLHHTMDYEYELLVNGKVVGGKREFRTFPAKGAASKFNFAFGGCAGYTPQYEKMWSLIDKYDPLALLMLGDNVYIDDPEHQLTNHYCYYRRHSQPDWRKLVGSTAVSSIWDDHDFGMNDCQGGPAIDVPAWKRPVFETFRNNWNNHSYAGGDKQPGVWHDYYIGDVHFILLDCRYYRDREGGTMIGPVQKKWLKEMLKNSKGTFKMLASSVPWSAGVKPGSKDTWDGFNDEREEIFGFIRDNKIEGVVLMAADRHRVDYRKTPRPDAYDLYEMMSARLTNVHTHGLVENAKGSEFIMGHNQTPAFANVEIDTTLEDPTLTYRIITIENEEVGKAELKLSELKFE